MPGMHYCLNPSPVCQHALGWTLDCTQGGEGRQRGLTVRDDLSHQSLHEQDSQPLGQLLPHEGEGKSLQGAADQGQSTHSSKHDAPSPDGGLLLVEVWVVKDAQDVGEGEGEGGHHDAQPC